MIISLAEAKQYLKVELDFVEDDNLLNDMIIAAENYLKNATGKTFDNTNALAKLAMRMLVSHWYDNRNPVLIGVVSEAMQLSLKSIIFQLDMCD